MIVVPGPRSDDKDVDVKDFVGCSMTLAVIALVCLSSLLSWRELMYLCFSRQTDGQLMGYREPGRRMTEPTLVSFEFTDPELGTRRCAQTLPSGWQIPDGPLRVEFIPGAHSYARIAGQTQHWSLWIFGGSLLVAGIFVARTIREANSRFRPRREPA